MTIKINIKWIRFFGIAGMLGGIILFIGDMLFYYSPNSTDFLQNMAVTSDARIIASGVCALLTSWLYLLGAGQVYYAFKIDQSKAKYIVFFLSPASGLRTALSTPRILPSPSAQNLHWQISLIWSVA